MPTRKTTAKTVKPASAKKVTQAAAPLTDVAVEAPKEAAEAAAKPVVETVQTAPKAAIEKPAAKPATEAAAEVLAQAKKQVEAATKAMTGGYGDFAVQGKENVEALVRSGNIMAKGMETLGKEIMDFSRVSFEGNVQATKALFGAKTFQDLVTMQSDHARKSMDQFMAEGAKLTELSVKVAGEAMAPIQARVDLTVKQFVKPVRF